MVWSLHFAQLLIHPSIHPLLFYYNTHSAGGEKKYDLMYYLKGAAAGGICCSITHGALTPVDVVKVRCKATNVGCRLDENIGYIYLFIWLLLVCGCSLFVAFLTVLTHRWLHSPNNKTDSRSARPCQSKFPVV